jgi:outer membrane protein TolC
MKTLWVLSLLLVVQGAALAQTTVPAGGPAGVPPGPAAPPPVADIPRPKMPPVDDPMLAAPPRPARSVASWSEALSQMQARSTDLRIAVDQVLQAEGLTRAALGNYLPSIVGNGQYIHEILTRNGPLSPVAVSEGLVNSTTAPIPNTLNGNVTLTQSLVNVQAIDQIGMFGLGERAAKFSLDDRRRTIATTLASEIVAVVTAERVAEINRVALRVALEQFALVRERQGLGGATLLDVVRAEQNAEDARTALIEGDETLREAREALGLALGTTVETGVDPTFNIDGVAADVMRSCRAVEGIEERPDVAAARTQLEVAKRNLREVWLGFLPTLTGESVVSATTSVPIGFPNPTWNIQALLTVPLWDGGTRYGNAKVAGAVADIAEQQLVAVRRLDGVQVEQARRQLLVAQQADRVALHERDLAVKSEALTEIAYLAGQSTSLELVTASERRRQAELNLAVKDYGITTARLVATLALATCSW